MAVSEKIGKGERTLREDVGQEDGRFCALCGEVLRAGGAPLFSPPSFYPATVGFLGILEAVRTARRSVYLEYYRIRGGRAWQMLLPLLLDRAKAGVRVCVSCDAFGSRPAMGREDIRALRAAGAEVRFGYHQGGSFLARDHRKIAVVDGRIAFLGGFNLADEYFSPDKIRDAAFCLRGEGAVAAEWLFLRRWARADLSAFRRESADVPDFSGELPNLRERRRDRAKTEPAPAIGSAFRAGRMAGVRLAPILQTESGGELFPYPAASGRLPVRKSPSPCGYLFGGGPRAPIGERVMVSLFDAARESVTILTPYLFPTKPVREALYRAVRRGVNVRLILPARYDILPGALLSRSWYRPLLAAGVRLRAYRGGFLHEKLILIDRCAVLGGSYNLDRISLRMNYEDGLLLFDPAAITPVFDHVAETEEKTFPIF